MEAKSSDWWILYTMAVAGNKRSKKFFGIVFEGLSDVWNFMRCFNIYYSNFFKGQQYEK